MKKFSTQKQLGSEPGLIFVCHPELVSGSEAWETKSTPLSNSLPGRENTNPLQGRGSSCANNCELQMRKRGKIISAPSLALPRGEGKKVAFTLAEVFHPAEQSKRTAFTLTEVLITLGIIGVVAALTMPALISNHKKQVVETKLKRFYSTMNQAIIRSELDNGPKENWNFELSKTGKGYDEETLKKFYNTYYKNYIKVLKTDFFINPYDNNQHMRFYFADGSISLMSWYGADYWYCIDQKSADNPFVGKNCFPFALMPASEEKGQQRTKYFRNKGLEPYIVPKTWDGTREGLKENPLNYTKLIQLNGWKIPEDYPLKF